MLVHWKQSGGPLKGRSLYVTALATLTVKLNSTIGTKYSSMLHHIIKHGGDMTAVNVD